VPVVELAGAHAGSVTDAVLRAVVDVLSAHDLEHFLVARRRSGSRVAVPAERVEELGVALRRLGTLAPVVARVEMAGTDPWVGPAVDAPDLAAFAGLDRVQIHAVVRDPASGLALGPRQGCRIELWSATSTGGLRAPAWNPATGEVTAQDRENPGLLELPGCVVRVIPPFSQRDVFEVGFPIDAVITWVDNADPTWRELRRRRLVHLGLEENAGGGDERYFRDHGELRYLLRSLDRYAPWLRRIHLVTAGQRPSWLVHDHPRLAVVDHREIIEQSALPTFSSRPIAARIHRIPELSEHFLYFNDDVILGRRVEPELFFTANGLSRFFLSRAQVPREPTTVPHLGGRQVVQRLLYDDHRVHLSRTFRHTPYALTRQVFRLIEERYGDELTSTVHRPFRTPDDIIPEWLAHYLGYLEGLALPGDISYDYFQVGHQRSMDEMEALLTNRKLDCFVVNDVGYDDLEPDEAGARLRSLLEQLLPGPSSFERATNW
jgi:hypothetical protein